MPDGIVVKVVTVGSKDVGFVELVPSDWPSKIVGSIESALRSQAQ